jgi:predicted Zn-dependent protease
LREASEDGAVTLRVRRGTETLQVVVTPDRSCAYQFYLVEDDDLNAAADGRRIYLNRGMLRFVRSDEELALVLGHELAHNAMRHVEAMQTNATMGALGGAVLDILAAAGGVNTGGAFTDAGGDIGRMMFSREFESEADYVGLYFAARAGFDISNVEHFWRRMAAEHPTSIRLAYTHPTSAERFLTIAAAREEISAKLARNEPLRPNMGRDQGNRRSQDSGAPPAQPSAPEAEAPTVEAAEPPAPDAGAVAITPRQEAD